MFLKNRAKYVDGFSIIQHDLISKCASVVIYLQIEQRLWVCKCGTLQQLLVTSDYRFMEVEGIFLLCSHMVEGLRELFGASSKVTNPFHEDYTLMT